ncbi:dihydroorotase [Chondromyces apiculatus]|uniref:Dihydroorotase n=1 Tax=Chondromyces apiculatus DSM 436 TaxID=1192034 RepID=A0A017T4F7_9BACT|nr:dihydroorotase [Chondromyces apiculatus]EYF03695.1 Dihydroorotase [Chondromyces apiculatus DSM 436]
MAAPVPAQVVPAHTTLPLLIITGVRAVDPAQRLDAVVDVVMEGGSISRIGRGAATQDLLQSEQAMVVRGDGLLLLPAFIDMHAHLREPGQEYKEDIASGLAAAAAGGFAHVCAMPNTRPVNDTRAVTEAMIARARSVGGPALHPIGAITVGQRGQELTEMADLKEAGAVGVSDDGRCVTSSAVMRRALEYASTFDLAVIQHAEDHALTEGAQMHEGAISTRLGLRGWPRVAEDIIVARDVLLAEATGARYHVAHVSSLGAVRILREAKSRGISVTAEVTPHHLTLTDEAVIGYDAVCKVNPPLREQADVDALREALADGTIDVIATDHAPHSSLEKDCEFVEASPGMLGLELVVPVLLGLVRAGNLPLGRVVDALTRAPARVVGLDAPTLAQGARAELCLVDPEHRYRLDPSRLRSKSRNTPLLGRELCGQVCLTMAGGRIVFVDPLIEAQRSAPQAPGGAGS